MISLVSPNDIQTDVRKSYKIIGLPGTGKTFTLLQIVKNYVSDGIAMKDIIYCSHTRAAIGEVQERIVKLLPQLTDKDLKSIKTMHSLSFGLVRQDLGNKFKKQNNIRKIKEDFFKEFRINYQHKFTFLKFISSDNPTVYDLRNIESLNELQPSIFFKLHADLQIKFPDDDIKSSFDYLREYWSRLSIEDDDEYNEDEEFENINEELSKLAIQVSFLFHQQWSLYKQQNYIFEFNDLLLHCFKNRLYPQCTILIMDEFQDFSPLQFEVFKVWADNTKVTIIAGDPNQAIYGFQNSSPQFLQDYEATEPEIILDVSYRLPPKIIELAQQMITSNNYLSSYQSHVSIDREGSIEEVDLSEIDIEPDESVFVLCRTNSMIEVISNKLRESGIMNCIYPSKSNNSAEKKEIEMYYDVIYKLTYVGPNSDVVFTGDEIRVLLKLSEVPQNFNNVINISNRKSLFLYHEYHKLQQLLQEEEEVGIEKELLLSMINLVGPEILELLTRKISKATKASIKKGIEKGWNKTQLINSLDQVKVMTIHKSKGKEADLVIVVNRATHYEKRGEENEDEERRIWYVAVTRAKNRLIIASYEDEFEYTKTKYV
ncbi:MAG: ATP-dependent DNA helicase UvrD2 [Candidatus Heimdallarchaeota archaeon LC_2]|nr:MAG: ATP-dependent DNA helicase UvrD2 [Candidatus Heimdallarchaeota archaeon LC_2]